MNNIIFNFIINSLQFTEFNLFVYLFIYTSMKKIEKEKNLKVMNYDFYPSIYFILFCFCNRLAITVSNEFYYILNNIIRIYFKCK